jgi:hypothetical protein
MVAWVCIGLRWTMTPVVCSWEPWLPSLCLHLLCRQITTIFSVSCGADFFQDLDLIRERLKAAQAHAKGA